MDYYILPECFVDTNLIETLVPPVKGYNHQMGCGTVASKMQKNLADGFALGIIDKDKKELDYLKSFDEIIVKGNLCLHKHKTKHHYIIQIRPAIERFMLNNAQSCGISIETFGLPSNFDDLKKVAKTTRSKHDQKFKDFFRALKKAKAYDIELLRLWISYLKETNYHADVTVLKALEVHPEQASDRISPR